MDERYRDEIAAASRLFIRAIIEKEQDIEAATMTVDALARSLLREIGRATVLGIYEELRRRAVAKASYAGLSVHRSRIIAVMTLFGVLIFASPYLRDARTKRTSRPLSDLGLRHGTRTPAVERALTDFGAEESFGQAAKRFREHYGFEVGRTTVLRVVERHAEAAEKFVHERLEEAHRFCHPILMH